MELGSDLRVPYDYFVRFHPHHKLGGYLWWGAVLVYYYQV